MNRCRRTLSFALPLVSLLFFSGRPASAQPASSPYDVTTYPVVVTDPRTRDVVIAKATYGEGLAFEIASLPGTAGARRPAVVFVNGVGGKLNEWEIYRSWARLVAARGLAGITFETKTSGSPAGVSAFFEHLRKNADALGLDLARLAAWSCSANVFAALPAIMTGEPIAFKAAVIYYGSGEAPVLRKDLPVYWVLAGRDGERLVERQKALFERAVKEKLPWTMVSAPDLPHAFDGVEDTPNSRRVVRETLEFLVALLAPSAPPTDVPLARRATAFMYANEPDRAVAVYREILAKTPSDGEARRLLGLALSRAGKPDEAVAELEKAIALGEDGAAIHQNLGDALLAVKRPAEAAVHLRTAVESGRRYPPVLFNLVCAEALSGAKDQAFAHLKELADTGWTGRAQVESDPDLAALRSDPRWAEALARFAVTPGAR